MIETGVDVECVSGQVAVKFSEISVSHALVRILNRVAVEVWKTQRAGQIRTVYDSPHRHDLKAVKERVAEQLVEMLHHAVCLSIDYS